MTEFIRGERTSEHGAWKKAVCICGLECKSIEVVQLKNGAIVPFKCPNCERVFAKEYLQEYCWNVRDYNLTGDDIAAIERIIKEK